MDYYGLNEFINSIARADERVCDIKVRNMNQDTVHNVPFLDHCDHLCKKHNTNRLRLLSVIQQKLNGDMIVRLNRSPVFNDKLKVLMGEWGETRDPIDLFRCPTDCYDSSNIEGIIKSVQSNDDDYSKVSSELAVADTDLYETMERLKGNYHTCGEDINRNLSEIEERRDEYSLEPILRNILSELSTKQKTFYLGNSLLSDGDEKIVDDVNRRINRAIPENIHVMFMNSLLIPTLMAKSMEDHRSTCMQLKESIEQKQANLNDIMVRIGPREPFSDSIMNLLTGFTTYFEEPDGDLPSDDDEPSEDKIKGIIDNLVNRSFDNDKEDEEDGGGGEGEGGEEDGEDGEDEEDGEDGEGEQEMHHLKIVMDKIKDDVNEELENKETEQVGGTFASFF